METRARAAKSGEAVHDWKGEGHFDEAGEVVPAGVSAVGSGAGRAGVELSDAEDSFEDGGEDEGSGDYPGGAAIGEAPH